MKQNFKLNINQPCPKKFENFEATQNGGFCDACQTEVIDFTKMSENEIKEYFKNYSKKTCGRFYDSQLKIYSNDKKKQKSKLSFALLGVTILSLFVTDKSIAQKNKSVIEISEKGEIQGEISKNIGNHTITGTVIEEYSGEPLIGVTVYLKHNTSISTITNPDGKFKLKIPESDMQGVLVFAFVGYCREEIVISQINTNKLNITMKLYEDCISIGEVSVNQIYQSKPSLWQRFKNIFRRKGKKT